jgi:hypothetical protein
MWTVPMTLDHCHDTQNYFFVKKKKPSKFWELSSARRAGR